MSFRRLFPVLALVCFVWLSATPARADTLLPPAYDVTGALLIVGNNVCSGLPCTETVSFSFDLGYLEYLPGLFKPYIVNVVADWSGALAFTESSAGPIPADLVFGFGLGEGGTEIDIRAPAPIRGPMGFLNWVPTDPPVFENQAVLYSCGTTTCVTDLVPPPLQHAPPDAGILLDGPAVFTVKAIPEPATLTLLFSGLLLLGLGGAVSREF